MSDQPPVSWTVTDVLAIWGAVVASLALVQPWIWALWKRFFRGGRVHIHKSGLLEIGYSTFGPTINLNGTLAAVHRDQFISNIELEITRKKDKAKHRFEWGAFLSNIINIANPTDTTLEIPRGFMVTCQQPHKYNIQFRDDDVKSDMRPIADDLSRAWHESMDEERKKHTTTTDSSGTVVMRSAARPDDVVFEEFCKTPAMRDAHDKTRRLCYWEEGDYVLKMTVSTERPTGQLSEEWKFTLTKDDCERLQRNSLHLLLQLCGQTTRPFFFAIATYMTLRAKE